MDKKRSFSIFDDPYYNLSAVASANEFTGIAPSVSESGNQAAALAALYAAKKRQRDTRKD